MLSWAIVVFWRKGCCWFSLVCRSVVLATRVKTEFTPQKSNMDTKNDGLENISPFKHGVILGIQPLVFRGLDLIIWGLSKRVLTPPINKVVIPRRWGLAPWFSSLCGVFASSEISPL